MGQNRPPGYGNNECTSLNGLVGHDKVLPHENEAPHCGTEVPNDKFDGEQRQVHKDQNAEDDKRKFHGLITTNDNMDKFEQNVLINVPNVGEAKEDVNIFTDKSMFIVLESLFLIHQLDQKAKISPDLN
ncbi:hypothetical protein Pfo_031192 [Paulownia fortunei]|nr:hypothetical protein Pfo_031192 [Paulownia fortunei]